MPAFDLGLFANQQSFLVLQEGDHEGFLADQSSLQKMDREVWNSGRLSAGSELR